MGETRTVRLNYLAILVSALVYFALEAMWFSIFMKEWMIGNRQTAEDLEQLQQQGHSPLIAYAMAFAGALVIAAVISLLTQMTGRQTIIRGVFISIVSWIGFVLTTWSTEYAFEARDWKSLGINIGASLIGMVLMGAIVGGWKAKPKDSIPVSVPLG
jgi:uncharacterized protein DUF1761